MLARSVSREDRWINRLRDADQAFLSSDGTSGLSSGLAALRRRFFVREATVTATLVVLAVCIGHVRPLFGGTSLHIGLLVGFLGLAGPELTWAAIGSLLDITKAERPVAQPDDADGLSDNMLADIQRLTHRFTARLGILLAAYALLHYISDLLDVWRLLHDLADAIRRLF